ncbi:hypothetical protein BH10ACT3_BH10ACT3_23810 [soil metagenome]
MDLGASDRLTSSDGDPHGSGDATGTLALARQLPAETCTDSTHEYCLTVSNPMARTALAAVASSAGWEERRTIGPNTLVVIDVAPVRPLLGASQRSVMVVESTPFAASRALRLLADGAIMAAFSVDEPQDLVPALESLRAQRAMVPVRLFNQAAQMPKLSQRQVDVLGALVVGQANRDIARGIYLSEASVKREIAELFHLLDVSSRLNLAGRGASLGIPARLMLP